MTGGPCRDRRSSETSSIPRHVGRESPESPEQFREQYWSRERGAVKTPAGPGESLSVSRCQQSLHRASFRAVSASGSTPSAFLVPPHSPRIARNPLEHDRKRPPHFSCHGRFCGGFGAPGLSRHDGAGRGGLPSTTFNPDERISKPPRLWQRDCGTRVRASDDRSRQDLRDRHERREQAPRETGEHVRPVRIEVAPRSPAVAPARRRRRLAADPALAGSPRPRRRSRRRRHVEPCRPLARGEARRARVGIAIVFTVFFILAVLVAASRSRRS